MSCFLSYIVELIVKLIVIVLRESTFNTIALFDLSINDYYLDSSFSHDCCRDEEHQRVQLNDLLGGKRMRNCLGKSKEWKNGQASA